jgi:hypothetical protein
MRPAASSIVSPDCNAEVIAESVKLGMISLPGVMTPTEAFAALAMPAQRAQAVPGRAGFPAVVKALLAVLPAGTPLMPVGGITPRQHGHLARGRRNGLRHRLRALQAGQERCRRGRGRPQVRRGMAAAAARLSGAGARPATMSSHATYASPAVRRLRDDLALALRAAAHHGLSEGVCNHFSVALPGAQEQFLINPRGLHWSEIAADDIVLIDADGNVLAGGIAWNLRRCSFTARSIASPAMRWCCTATCRMPPR